MSEERDIVGRLVSADRVPVEERYCSALAGQNRAKARANASDGKLKQSYLDLAQKYEGEAKAHKKKMVPGQEMHDGLKRQREALENLGWNY